MHSVHPDGEDQTFKRALEDRDERAFVELVNRYQSSLLRLALVHCNNRAVAEDVVQETWLGVLRGIERFEGRSSFKTWLFRILVNRARTRAVLEGRTVAFSSLEGDEPSVSPDRFLGPDHPEWAGHWSVPPRSWGASPESELLSKETLELVERAIAALPLAQREVITLRDVDGWSSEEVCNALDISETNQRVLLHRARAKVRAALECHFDPDLQ
jgi:RNA polymerase sigma-70 factor (ECF subfamily)